VWAIDYRGSWDRAKHKPPGDMAKRSMKEISSSSGFFPYQSSDDFNTKNALRERLTGLDNKIVLGNKYERGIQPDMGGVYYISLVVDM
jgi:hypothetical protein